MGVGIPVGKDSMSMAMRCTDDGDKKEVTAPLLLIVTAFAPVDDVAKTLSHGGARLGGSPLAQVFNTLAEAPADDPADLKAFFNACQDLKVKQPNVVLAYHDRSDGGLFTTLAEMCSAGRVGAEISLDALPGAVADPVATLFNEELGGVLQVRRDDLTHLVSAFAHFGFHTSSLHMIGTLTADESFAINCAAEVLFSSTRAELQLLWAETSFRMQSISDDLDTSREEYALPTLLREVPAIRPRVVVLREQGINCHVGMALVFAAAGFDAVDVHISYILDRRLLHAMSFASPPRLDSVDDDALSQAGSNEDVDAGPVSYAEYSARMEEILDDSCSESSEDGFIYDGVDAPKLDYKDQLREALSDDGADEGVLEDEKDELRVAPLIVAQDNDEELASHQVCMLSPNVQVV
ncbi:PurM C-terminal domain-like protein [Auricularia subglabra TFB-10046 SS5]|nr:PurM C-terminal domain-like protein [Auricularia subglabra TFB-10046 SS5]